MLGMKSIVSLVAYVFVLFSFSSVTMAQDELKKRENVKYYRAIHFNFKPGHNEAAWELLYEKFQPASDKAGNRFVAIDWETGPWDTTIYLTLSDGYGAMEYAQSPGGAAFMAALAEMEGSKEAAEALFKKWVSHIDSTDTDVGHMHMPPKEDSKE